MFLLKKENDFLHSASSLSRQTSHSISPTPASFSSERSAQAAFLFNLHSVSLVQGASVCRPYIFYTTEYTTSLILLCRREIDPALVAVSAQVLSVALQILIKTDKDFPVCNIHPPVVMVMNRPTEDSSHCVASVPGQRAAMGNLVRRNQSICL